MSATGVVGRPQPSSLSDERRGALADDDHAQDDGHRDPEPELPVDGRVEEIKLPRIDPAAELVAQEDKAAEPAQQATQKCDGKRIRPGSEL